MAFTCCCCIEPETPEGKALSARLAGEMELLDEGRGGRGG
jgi:hypothetical protein